MLYMHLLKKLSRTLVAVVLIPAAMNLWAKDASPPQVLASPPQVLASPPQVLASIKPLQLISQAITAGVSDTEVLLPPGASPHSYSLRVSDRRKLDSANIVLWIGPDMEIFLNTVLQKTKNTKAIAMMDIAGITKREEKEKHSHHGYKNHDRDDHHSHDHNHDHDHGDYDPHIWLDPCNAITMARAISDYLQKIDKNETHQHKYASNLRVFIDKINEADHHNAKLLANVKEKPFFVFHDAYGHLEDHYGLNVAGYFTINPQQQPGAKHLDSIRKQLENAGSSSIFMEPQFQPVYINRLTEGLSVNVGVLDPLGMDIETTKDGYIQFLNSLVSSIHNSLSILKES